jgi:hypothetical protein
MRDFAAAEDCIGSMLLKKILRGVSEQYWDLDATSIHRTGFDDSVIALGGHATEFFLTASVKLSPRLSFDQNHLRAGVPRQRTLFPAHGLTRLATPSGSGDHFVERQPCG